MKRLADIVYIFDGQRFLSSGQVGALLKIDQRTALRWVARLKKGTAPQVLKALVWTQDPSNNFVYFREDTVLALKKILDVHRPQRIRR